LADLFGTASTQPPFGKPYFVNAASSEIPCPPHHRRHHLGKIQGKKAS
jgi:hypothetical protein